MTLFTLILVCLGTAIGAEVPIDFDDPWSQLAFARTLDKQEGGSRDELAVALHRLSEDPVVGQQALDELYDLAVTETVRPGWRDLYDTLLSRANNRSDDGKLLLTLRSLQARIEDGGTRPEAVKRLKALLDRHPDRDDVRLATARGLLASDLAEQAEPVFASLDGGVASRGLLLSLLALNRLDEAKEVIKAVKIPKQDPLAKAASDGGLALRVGALVDGGYTDAAEALLTRFDTDATDEAAWSRVAEARLLEGKPKAAAALFDKLVKAKPTSSRLRGRWVSALLEDKDTRGAEAAAGTDEQASQLVYAVMLLLDATAPVLQRVDEIERAYRIAPDHPEVVRQRAELLLAQGRSKEAVKVLEPAMEKRPRAYELQAVFDRAALATGAPQVVLDSHRASLRRAGPWDFWFKVGSVAGMHTLMAEHEKNLDAFPAAVFHYRAALALLPDQQGYYKGLGGTLWAAGRLDSGRAAYLYALKMDPIDIDA
ncbi:MAG: tetratricopeptide repeat protein, partial [Myxococcota bacterium]